MRNLVLRSLGSADRLALEADLKDVSLASGDVLYEPNYAVDWVYFPQTAVLSVVTVMTDGRTIESDTIGCESVVGALAALGGAVSTSRTFTQIAGLATRMTRQPAPPPRGDQHGISQAAGAPFSGQSGAGPPVGGVQRVARRQSAIVPLAADLARPNCQQRDRTNARVLGDDGGGSPHHDHRSAPQSGGGETHPKSQAPHRNT